MDSQYIALGILIPFVGTSLGSACVYFLKGNKTTGGNAPVIPPDVEKGLTGFAAGVMVAASIWSLLIPAMEESGSLGKFAFLPAVIGFWIGTLFLFALDKLIPHLHLNAEKAEGPRSSFQRTTMMLLAVTIHNIPEGMAVGVVYAAECLPEMSACPLVRRLHFPSGLPFKTSRKGRLFLCPCTQMDRINIKLS